MNNDKVMIRDLVNTILKYKKTVAVICALSIAFSVQLTFWITKQFTSTFEINVYSKYFQNPLISEIIPDVYSIPEMRFAIDSMVKEAISDDYIDSIGKEYKIYSETNDEREIARERQFLRDRFSYYSTGGQSYQISFSHSDPYVAKAVAEKTLQVVKDHIINKRIKTIELIRSVMTKKLNSFNASQKLSQKGSEKVLASKSPDVLKEELLKIETSLAALSKQYSGNHPVMLNLKQRKETVTSWLKEFDISNVDEEIDLFVGMSSDKIVSEQLSSKFYTKYHDFTIALEIEKKSLEGYIGMIRNPQLPTAPVWPKKRLFASLGLILGFVISFIFIFVQEVILPSRDEQMELEARALNTLVLGTLPKIVPSRIDSEVSNNERTSVRI